MIRRQIFVRFRCSRDDNTHCFFGQEVVAVNLRPRYFRTVLVDILKDNVGLSFPHVLHAYFPVERQCDNLGSSSAYRSGTRSRVSRVLRLAVPACDADDHARQVQGQILPHGGPVPVIFPRTCLRGSGLPQTVREVTYIAAEAGRVTNPWAWTSSSVFVMKRVSELICSCHRRITWEKDTFWCRG